MGSIVHSNGMIWTNLNLTLAREVFFKDALKRFFCNYKESYSS
jgi:hypothetical protein